MINDNHTRLQSRPFIVYPDSDISGTAGGNANRENYCDLDYTSASRYRLNRDDHNNIFQFFGNISTASNKPVYCLDKFADGPYNDVPYESRPFETIFPASTKRQKSMFGWIMANAYPAVSADATFALVNVDPAVSPALDDNDAYAAVQVALWVLLGQISLDEVYFLNCGGSDPHPKSDRLRTAVLNLLKLAGEYADGATDSSRPLPSTGAGKCAGAGIDCCNKSTMPSDPGAPYFIFQSCPDEVRTICGRLLIGPFKILSNFTGQPQIIVTPFCSCGDDYSATFMDFCGNPIGTPAIGQEFYIALRACKKQVCFTVTASYTGTITRVISMEAQSTALNYQPIGTSLEEEPVTLTAELCLCVNTPEGGGRCDHPSKSGQVGVNINNNNNNNNNNSSSNAGSSCGFPPLMPCMPFYWPYPPFPPYPPKPPYPPYPPEPPYPPYPPRPPYPPYPPEPPYPPYPPKPPYPPDPPCPPKPPYPPDPPCPPKPPCPPEPPCPSEPPCPPYPPCPPGPQKPPCLPFCKCGCCRRRNG